MDLAVKKIFQYSLLFIYFSIYLFYYIPITLLSVANYHFTFSSRAVEMFQDSLKVSHLLHVISVKVSRGERKVHG